MESIGESDTGADASGDAGGDAGAVEAGTDATAAGTGATEGAADFVELDVPHPATNTAVSATPTAMRAFTVDDGDGGRP